MTRHRLSPHFVVEEFDCRDGTRVPGGAEDDLELLCRWWLEPLRARFGRVTVHSGYRTKTYNELVGGARHSVHRMQTPMAGHDGQRGYLLATAADVSCAGGSSVLWQQWAARHRATSPHLHEHRRGGIGSYRNFVHLDTAGHRGWRG